MADDNLKDFAVSWTLFGLLFFCLITFAVSFMFFNNPTGLGDSQGVFDDTATSYQGDLQQLPSDSDALLNITSKTNPEASFLGSRDSTATSYGIMGSAKKFFTNSKVFISWILTDTSSQLLMAVFGGLFGLISLYYIVKWMRVGF